jgi:beta-galactosidase
MPRLPSARQWLADYEVTGLVVETDAEEGGKLQVYRKRYAEGQMVPFGENKGRQMYTVAVLPVTDMEPATDLRPSISYKMDGAELPAMALPRDTLAGKKTARFNQKQWRQYQLRD